MAFESGADFESSVKAAYAALMAATKAAGRLPSDLSFHRTLDETLDTHLAATSTRTLRLANALWTPVTNPPGRKLGGIDDVAQQHEQGAWAAAPGFSRVVGSIDTLLERIDVGLDEVLRRPAHAQRQHAVGAQTKIPATGAVRKAQGSVGKPQLAFDDAVDNSSAPFAWRIKEKPHALVPLQHVVGAGDAMDSHLASLGVGFEMPHPYAHEIENQPVAAQLYEQREPREPKPWDDTPFEFVDQPEALDRMMRLVRGASEVAIDLEHHSYRSYQGFTCLVQLSTRTHDFVIDALTLRSHLHVLNEITADPSVVKVLHGAESDVLWLQRDFGVYLVGLFDTYHASHVLNMPHHSLAHLLRTYCSFEADKKHQLADWRVRPLPADMMAYARSDTHFLLYVFDRMRNELVERGRRLVGCDVGTPGEAYFGQLNLGEGHSVVQAPGDAMDVVVRRSRQTALRRYVKEAYDADHGLGANGWSSVLRKWRQHALDSYGLAVFRALHRWRDACARAEDESPAFVMPTHMLFAVAERAPKDVATLLAACRPNAPPLVRLHAVEIVALVKQAEEAAKKREEEFGALVGEAHREAVGGNEAAAPTHIRFDQQDEEEEEDEREDVLTEEVLAGARALVAPVSGLFGNVQHTEHVSNAARRAQEIRRTLVLTVAMPVE
ncbi:exosome nuclease subunit, partial [Coemansia sp. RSA 2703]